MSGGGNATMSVQSQASIRRRLARNGARSIPPNWAGKCSSRRKRSPQKGERSSGVTRIEMVKRGGYLDQCLKKGFLRLIEGEPDALPMLVSEEELASPVAGESFCEALHEFQSRRHAFSIGDLAASGVLAIFGGGPTAQSEPRPWFAGLLVGVDASLWRVSRLAAHCPVPVVSLRVGRLTAEWLLPGRRWRGVGGVRSMGRFVALQLVEDRRHLERHLVASVHRRIALGVQHVHRVVPWIDLEPASQRQGRGLRQIVPVDLGSHLAQVRHPGRSIAFSSESPSVGVFCAFSTFDRSTNCA